MTCRSFDDFSCFVTHPCDVLLVQDHNKEDTNNLLRVCSIFMKYTFSLFNHRWHLTVWTSVYVVKIIGAWQVSHCDGELRNHIQSTPLCKHNYAGDNGTMPGQPLKSNKINFILRGHSHDVDTALKQRCAIVTCEPNCLHLLWPHES